LILTVSAPKVAKLATFVLKVANFTTFFCKTASLLWLRLLA